MPFNRFKTPDGQTVDDPQWQKNIVDQLNKVQADHPDQILGWVGWLKAPTSTDATVQKMPLRCCGRAKCP